MRALDVVGPVRGAVEAVQSPMSPHQRHGTTAGRVFNDLRNTARREGRSMDDLFVYYVLASGFLHLARWR